MASELQRKLDYILDEKANKIIPYNIRKGVEIFGISGECVGVDSTDATATPSDIREGKTAYVNDQKITGTFKGVETTDATATAEHILIGRSAYTAEGMTSGKMPNNGILNYTPTAESQDIPAGYTSGGTVKGDANLVAENIKKGTTIFGIEGQAEDAFTDHEEYDECLALVNEIQSEVLDFPEEMEGNYIISTIEPIGEYRKLVWIQRSVNLFNHYNPYSLPAYVATADSTVRYSVGANSICQQIQPNTTYTISKQIGKTFRVATMETRPTLSWTEFPGDNNDIYYDWAIETPIISTVANHTGDSITITTETNAHFMLVNFLNEDNGESASEVDTIINSIQIEENKQKTDRVDYVPMAIYILKNDEYIKI